jgi:hypothetical protein
VFIPGRMSDRVAIGGGISFPSLSEKSVGNMGAFLRNRRSTGLRADSLYAILFEYDELGFRVA